MSNGLKLRPRIGSQSGTEIHAVVGLAISWWEASEDVLMGLFKTICQEREPLILETYVKSPRNRRNEILKLALKRYKQRFRDEEIKQIIAAMKQLDNLAAVRNEIAHGHCGEYREVNEHGEVLMSGFYWLPSINEGIWHARTVRHAHTAETMASFVTEVRKYRGIIMDIDLAVILRDQEENQRLSPETRSVIQIAKLVTDGSILPQDVLLNLKPA